MELKQSGPMTEREPRYFVSGDKWLRLPGGKLDDTDKQLLKDCGKGVVVITMREMLNKMQQQDPEKFEGFHKEMNVKHGKLLTVEELYRLSELGNQTMNQYRKMVMWMDISHAAKIRRWRVEEHLTWRAIARRQMHDSSQLIGMALCERAAQMCGENYELEPWN